MDPYPWIIWYLWKARNEKLFKGIDRNPLELLKHAESECKAWFEAKSNDTNHVIQQTNEQAPSLVNICLVDGSWKTDAKYSGFGWAWMDHNGGLQLLGMRNKENLMSSLHAELEALVWAMKEMEKTRSCQHFGTDSKEVIAMLKSPQEWPSFSTELEEVFELQQRFNDFKISYIPRQSNQKADGLARIARSFHRNLSFIGCSIPVWIPRPPHVIE